MSVDNNKHAVSSAPGKLIICGEYAVLDGHPALVMALDRRIHLSLARRSEPGVLLSCPGFSTQPQSIEHLHWQGPESFALFRQLFMQLLQQHVDDAQAFLNQGWLLNSDSRAFFDGDAKLGLGSSAALCVALDDLFFASGASRLAPERAELRWRRLQQVHNLAQGKVGSGVDLAASLHGGVLAFDNKTPRFDALSLPAGLMLDFIWTGQSASTPAMLGSLKQWRDNNADECQAFIDELGLCSEAAITYALQHNQQASAQTFIALIAKFSATLFEFDLRAALGIFAAGHAELYQHSLAFTACLYKPCGAGGGDLGLLLSADKEQRKQMLHTIQQQGLRCLNLQLEANASAGKREA